MNYSLYSSISQLREGVYIYLFRYKPNQMVFNLNILQLANWCQLVLSVPEIRDAPITPEFFDNLKFSSIFCKI